MQQETDEGQEMQRRQGRGQALVVARQAAEARGPGEAALDDPAPGQEHEAALGLGQLDHLQLDAVRGGRGRWLLAGVALVDVGQLDVLAGHRLHRCGQRRHLRALLLVGGRHQQRQQVAQGVDGGMDLRSLAPLVPVVAGARAALGGRLQRAASRITARRLASGALRPAAAACAGRARSPRSSRPPASAASAGRPRPRRQVVRHQPPVRAGLARSSAGR